MNLFHLDLPGPVDLSESDLQNTSFYLWMALAGGDRRPPRNYWCRLVEVS